MQSTEAQLENILHFKSKNNWFYPESNKNRLTFFPQV